MLWLPEGGLPLWRSGEGAAVLICTQHSIGRPQRSAAGQTLRREPLLCTCHCLKLSPTLTGLCEWSTAGGSLSHEPRLANETEEVSGNNPSMEM